MNIHVLDNLLGSISANSTRFMVECSWPAGEILGAKEIRR
jgi:hypothetical protein